ncbi:MAG: hypothetical protein HS115_14535 [Spirochaetales bacterium]|nr:hypothetical protein [Spirochaetales bacterium]
MPRFKLRFDEFFKRMAVAFFELFGFRVTTEVEIFTYAPPERLPALAQIVQRPEPSGLEKNILDKLKESLYIRIKSFEPEDLWEGIMPTAMEADITDLIMPYYEKIKAEGKLEGELKGKLDTATQLLKEGLPLDLILRSTGLTVLDLRKVGLID